MCFDTQSSLTAWIIANSISIYLWCRNKNYDRWNAGFITTFTTIQLLEAGLWSSGKDSDVNSILTSLIAVMLMAQPLVQVYLGYTYTKEIILYYMSFIYLALFLYAIFKVLRTSSAGGASNASHYHSVVGPNGHWIWKNGSSDSVINGWVIGLLYLIGLFVPLLFMKDYRGLPLLFVGIVTAIYSLVISGKGEFGSMWCITAVLYSVVAIFV